ncbi:MAG: putative ABC transporter permease subunit [Myxococcota bacterium]
MLTRLLGPELLALKNQLRYSDPRERTRFYLFGAAGLIFWIGLFVFFWYALRLFLQVEIFGPYLVKKLLSILLLSLFSLLCFSNLINALSAYYLSEDLGLIHSLPLTQRQLFFARFAQTFLNSSWMLILFGLPVFLAYGMVYSASGIYYLGLFLFLVPYLLIPTAVGVSSATLLVNIFPARRTRELMVLISFLFVVGLFLLLRYLRPEKLVNADNFSDVMQFLGQLQSPTAPFLPSHWGTQALVPLLTGEAGEPGFYLLLTALSGAGAVVLASWVHLGLYLLGWNKALHASASTDRTPGVVDGFLRALTRPLPADMQAIILKDIKTFFRDAAEWPQLLLILALVAIYLYSIKVLPLDGPFITLRVHNLISFLNLAMVGFVVSSVAVRFLFTSVSMEGRAFWMLRASPLAPMRFLLAKFLVGFPLLASLGLLLVVASNLLLGVSPTLMAVGIFSMVGLSLSLTGLSIGIGAEYPNFKAENIAKIASGPGGILFMILAQLFVACILLVEAAPVYLLVRAEFQKRALTFTEGAVVGVGLLIALALNLGMAARRLQKGAKALQEMN